RERTLAPTSVEAPHPRAVPSGIREREGERAAYAIVRRCHDFVPQHGEGQEVAGRVEIGDRPYVLQLERATNVHLAIGGHTRRRIGKSDVLSFETKRQLDIGVIWRLLEAASVLGLIRDPSRTRAKWLHAGAIELVIALRAGDRFSQAPGDAVD